MYHGKITKAKKKRKYAIGRNASETTVGETKIKCLRTKGGGSKLKMISTENANVVFDGKSMICKIVDLAENPANKDFTRRRIITKGAILTVKTPEGNEIKAKVTSRPGQDGVLNAISPY